MRLFGSASTGKRYNLKTNENGIQVFGSAEISKRLDNNTLEAQDGIIITIIGVINRSRTLSNGFSPEVCSPFVLYQIIKYNKELVLPNRSIHVIIVIGADKGLVRVADLPTVL